MKSTVLTPAAGQSVVATSDAEHMHGHHEHGHGHGAAHADDIAATKDAYAGSIAATKDAYVGNVAATKDACQNEIVATKNAHIGGVSATKDAYVGNVAAIKDANAAELTAVKDARYDLSQVIERNAGEIEAREDRMKERMQEEFCDTKQSTWRVGERVLRSAAHTDEEMCKWFGRQQRQICEFETATAIGFKDAQATAYQIEGRTLLDAQRNANNLSVQATNNFNLVNAQVERVKAELSLQVQTGFAAAEVRARELAYAASKEQAAGFYDLRERIVAENQKTRDLIDVQERDRLRDTIQTLKAEKAAFFAARVPPIVP